MTEALGEWEHSDVMADPPKTIWDRDNPRLQRYWDSTSIRALLACPYRYYLSHVEGWQTLGQRVDLEFGRIAGEGLEAFYKAIIEDGKTHDDAVRDALRVVLNASWDEAGDRPLLGSYQKVWCCLGAVPYKNPKGNKAKCPWAFKGKFWSAPAPEQCSCGSPTRTWDQWLPDNPVKDRYQLVRLIVWYAEEVKAGHLQPISWSEGDGHPHRALVEVPWHLPLFQQDGRTYYLCGWFDAVKSLGGLAPEGGAFVTDYKTTKHTINPDFFLPYSVDIQVSMYDLSASVLFRDVLPYQGVAIEGIQTLKDGVRFGFQEFRIADERRAELTQDLQIWLKQAIEYARVGYWPQNRASCYLCQFKKVCALPREDHPNELAQRFTRMRWNPLTRQQENYDGKQGDSKDQGGHLHQGNPGTVGNSLDGSVSPGTLEDIS